METIQTILDLLNQPWLKGLMVMAGTFILRAWPRFVNEAVPFWTGIYSIITALLGGLFPEAANPSAMSEGFVVAAVASGGSWWGNLLVIIVREGIIPWIAGFGGARAVGQTKQHVEGVSIGHDAPAKPIEIKPFQMLLTPPQEKKVEAAKD